MHQKDGMVQTKTHKQLSFEVEKYVHAGVSPGWPNTKETHKKNFFLVFSFFSLFFCSSPGLGLAERADGGVPVDLLVAGQAGLHGWRLLLVAEV